MLVRGVNYRLMERWDGESSESVHEYGKPSQWSELWSGGMGEKKYTEIVWTY